MLNVQKIKKFLLRVQNNGFEKTEIVLYHLNVSFRRTLVWVKKDWVDADETSSLIYESADEHTKAMGGVQRFACFAFDSLNPAGSGGEKEPIDTCAFKIESQMASDQEAMSSEPATGEGLLGMLMRHNQEMHRQSNHAMGTLTFHLARTVEKQSEQIERLMADRIGTIEITEELMSRKHEREISSQAAQAKIIRDKEMFDKLMQLGPMMLNKLSGKEIIRQKDTVLESTVVQFMETIKPEHLDILSDSGLLNRQQMILFTTMLEQVTKRMMTIEDKKKMVETGRQATTNSLPEDEKPGEAAPKP